jgi:DNA-3-methyladenine glycosylase I
VEGRAKVNAPGSLEELPAKTKQSDVTSKDLKRHGFRFVGSTICHVFMQNG